MPRMDKLSNYRTTVMCTNGQISVTYVSTLIVDATPQRIALDFGGWDTVTTRRKMNQASRQFALGYSVYRDKGTTYVSTNHSQCAYPGHGTCLIDRETGIVTLGK